MTTIVTRTTVGSNTGKGSPLTHTEVDTNFVNLNTAKLETAAIPLGTLGAPSISFLSYSTTGIYSPAGDELGVSMLGSDKIRIKSTGEIIINATASRTTLSTTPRLQIEGSASSNQCSMSLTGAGAGGTLFPRLHLSKARSSVNAIVLEDDILGFISFNGGDGSSLVNAGFIKAEVDGTPSAGIVPGRLVFATVDTAGSSGERMIIKNNGNVSIDGTTFNVDAVNNRVGIGTSGPGSLLQVGTGALSSTNIAAFLGGSTTFENATTGNGPSITFNSDLDTGILNPSANTLGINTGGTRVITISDAQRVGIGTDSPGSYSTYGNKLVVYGTGTNGPGITIATGTADTGSLYFADGTTGNEVARGAVSYSHGDDALLFQTSATEKVRIDSSGRLLVGTPSTSAACTTLLQATGGTGGTLILSRNAATPADGEDLGFISFNDSSHIYNNAVIRAQRDAGTWNATTSKPTRLVFATTPDGSNGPSPRMTIKADGIINFSNAPTHADNTAATAAGLAVGDVYKTVLGVLMIRF